MLNAIVIDDDKLINTALEVFLEKVDHIQCLGTYTDPLEAVSAFKGEDEIHVLFLDVEFPDITGIEFLSNIPEHTQVVLMSSNQDYAVEAFNFDVADFLLKPISLARFLKACEKVSSGFEKDISVQDQKHLFVKDKSQLVKLDLADVSIIQALGDYVTLQTHKKKYVVHSSMKSIESKIPEEDFIRIHRSYIVNLNHITSMEDSTLVVADQVVPVSKSYRNKLLKRLNIA